MASVPMDRKTENMATSAVLIKADLVKLSKNNGATLGWAFL
jgi:hypothetical protein